MKNFFSLLLIFMVIGIYGHSQSLTLSDSIGAVANNATIDRMGHPADAEITSFFFVHNATGHSIDVLVKKVEISLVSGSSNTFCWGLCFPPNIYVSPTAVTIAPGATDSIDFSGHYNPLGFSGDSKLRYVFFDASNSSDSVCVNVTYGAYEVGIQTQSSKNVLSNAYPNPANTTVNFDYSINTGLTGTLIIRNVLGLVVKNTELKNTNGKLSVETTDLQDGVYFYSLNVDGKAVVTRKLIVKH